MERSLRVLLIEDEPTECLAITQCAENLEGIRLVGVTNNVDKALELVAHYLPDAIILDIELHKGRGNGFLFLEKLRDLNPSVIPYILVTTNNTSQITFDRIREIGADFIMSKYQEDYSAKTVIEFLYYMRNTIQHNARKSGIALELLTNETVEQISNRIQKRINTELELIGISPKQLGKKYLVEAIQIIMNKPTPHICAKIGVKYGKSDVSVERAMQNAINSAWRKSDINDLNQYYTARISSEKGVPTLTEFIYYYAEKLRIEL